MQSCSSNSSPNRRWKMEIWSAWCYCFLNGTSIGSRILDPGSGIRDQNPSAECWAWKGRTFRLYGSVPFQFWKVLHFSGRIFPTLRMTSLSNWNEHQQATVAMDTLPQRLQVITTWEINSRAKWRIWILRKHAIRIIKIPWICSKIMPSSQQYLSYAS